MEKKELDLFNPTKAELQVLAIQYKDLKINGIEDKEGYKIVHEAEMKLKSTRVAISKTRKEFTAPKQAEIKEAIELEKELLWIIVPIETSLKEQKALIEAEKERIKQTEIEKQRKFLQDRVDELFKYNYVHTNLYELSQMSDEDFQNQVFQAKTMFESQEIKNQLTYIDQCFHIETLKEHFEWKTVRETVKEKYEEKISQLEKEKKEREEFEEKKKQQEADQRKLDEDKQKIQDEKDKIENDKIEAERKKNEDIRVEKERKEAAEQATKEAEEKARQKKIEDELLEKQQQEKLEKEKKYKDFLFNNEWSYDKIIKEDWKVILYKKIDEFII